MRETHEKLKVDDQEKLNCYYAHAVKEEDSNDEMDVLHRRCYWILDKSQDDVVMVHYLRPQTSRVAPRDSIGNSAGASLGLQFRSQRPQRRAARKNEDTLKLLLEQDSGEQSNPDTESYKPGKSGSGSSGQYDSISNRPCTSGSVAVMSGQNIKISRRSSSATEHLLAEQSLDLFKFPSMLSEGEMLLSPTAPNRDPGLLLVNPGSPLNSAQEKRSLHPQLSFGVDLKSIHYGDEKGEEEDPLIPGFSTMNFPGLDKMFSDLEDNGNECYFESAGLAFTGRSNSGHMSPDPAKGPSALKVDGSSKNFEIQEAQNDTAKTVKRFLVPSFKKNVSVFSAGIQEPPSGSKPVRKRTNPTDVPLKASHEDRLAAVAIASKATSSQKREDQLQKLRDSRGMEEKGSDDDGDAPDLIETPNVLFRMQSHIVHGWDRNTENKNEDCVDDGSNTARIMFKQMSIDKKSEIFADLPTVPSSEMPPVEESPVETDGAAGFGSEQELSKSNTLNSDHNSVPNSRDPSFTSMLDSVQQVPVPPISHGPSASSVDDSLRQAFEVHQARIQDKTK